MATRSFNPIAILTLLSALAIPVTASADSARAPGGESGGGGGASGGPVAIMDIEVQDGITPAMGGKMEASVLAGLRSAGVEAVDNQRVREAFRQQPELVTCLTSSCLQALGNLVGATRFLKLELQGTGLNFVIVLEMYTSAQETPIKRVERRCDGCSLGDFDKNTRAATAELLAPPPKMPVVITSEPMGATLSIEGQELGSTPYEGALVAGAHTVRASLPGYQESETTLNVKEGVSEPQRLHVTLMRSMGDSSSSSSRRPFKLWKWVAAGAAVGALGAGVTWLVVDGDGTCSGQDTCPEIYDTKAQGIAALGAGVGLAGLSAWMILRDKKDAKAAEELVLMPTRGGAMARVGWRF